MILISHNLHDIFETADRITVLRLGRNVGIFERRDDDPAGGRRGDHRRPADEGRRASRPPPERPREHGGRRRRPIARRSSRRSSSRPGSQDSGSGRGRTSHRQPRPGADHHRRDRHRHLLRLRRPRTSSRPSTSSTSSTRWPARRCSPSASSSCCCSARSTSRSATWPGSAALVVAELQLPGSGHHYTGLVAIVLAVARRAAPIGLLQGSIVAFVGVPSFVVTLAGFLIWQGVILYSSRTRGTIIIQDRWINYTAQLPLLAEAGAG